MAKRREYRIFILSPARTGGPRTELLFSPRARFELAWRVQSEGATLGEVFSFLSGLYFRGKLGYANQFARPPRSVAGTLVITSSRGLIPADTFITKEDLIDFAGVPIDTRDKRYVEALRKSAMALAGKIRSNTEVVLLGSIGTKKYAELLVEIFGERLKFPAEFVGRGDMSRGGLMLRCMDANQELEYVPVLGAIRHGKRPPKLEPRRWRQN
jgi:hypothetical protein